MEEITVGLRCVARTSSCFHNIFRCILFHGPAESKRPIIPFPDQDKIRCGRLWYVKNFVRNGVPEQSRKTCINVLAAAT